MRSVVPCGEPGAPLLAGAALLYRAAMGARDAGFRRGWLRSARVPARVISIGNLAAGGTGKTPLVLLAAGHLAATGARVAVLTRGYGRSERGMIALAPGEGAPGWRRIGDEPALLRRALPGVPLVVAADRVAAAREAVRRFGADTLVLDDGFQHRWLARDVDVVLLDADRPLDNGHLLPRGMLREPPAALRRAHVAVLTADGPSADWEGAAARLAPWGGGLPMAGAARVPACWVDLATGARSAPDAPAGARALAFAGIARPERFRRMAVRLGLEVTGFLPFRDHHAYTPGDLRAIAAEARRRGAALAVTTEKDAVRLEGLPLPAGLSIQALRITVELVWRPEAFWRAVGGQGGQPAAGAMAD